MAIKAVIGSVLMYLILTFFTSFVCPVRALPEPPPSLGSVILSCPENCKLMFTENGQRLLRQLLGMKFRYTVIVPNVTDASYSTVTDKDPVGMELNYSWMLLKNSTGHPYLQVYPFFVALSLWTLKNEVYDFEVDIVQKPDSCWKGLNLECRLYSITSAILISISDAMTDVSLNDGDLQLCVKSYLRNLSLPLEGRTGCSQDMLLNSSKENVTLDYVRTPRLESVIVFIAQTFFTGTIFYFLPLLILKAIPSRYSLYLSDVAQEELQQFEYYNNLTPFNELFFAQKGRPNSCLTILYRVLAFVIVHAMIFFSVVTNLRLYPFLWKGHCAYTNLLRVTILSWIFTHPVASTYTCILLDIQPWVGYLFFAVALTLWSFVFVVFVTPVHTYHNLASGAFFKDIGVTFLANRNAGFPPSHICLVTSLRRHLEPRTFFHVLKKAFKSNVLYSVLMPFILPFMPVGFVFLVMLGMQLSKMDCNPVLRRLKLPYAFISLFPFLYFVFLLIDTCSTICWVVIFTVSGLFINSDQNLPYLVFLFSGAYYIYIPFHTMQEKYRTLKTIVFKAYDECRKANHFSDSSTGTATGEDCETFRLLEVTSSNYSSIANDSTRHSRCIQIERPPKQPSYLHASGIRKMEKALWKRIYTQILPLKRQLLCAVILSLLSFLILVVIMLALHAYHQVQRLKTIGKSFASLAAAALPQLIINFIRAPTEQTIKEEQWQSMATDMILEYMESVH